MFRTAFATLLLSLALFSCASTVRAQATNPNSDVAVSVSPTNPGPNQSVTISVQSFTTDLQAATIAWSVDKRVVSEGIGKDHFTFTTKSVGSPTSVSVTIRPIGSTPIIKSIVITPMSVDLLWQTTDSIVPPFYRGKALPTSESRLKFVAIPQVKSTNGALIPSGSFLYNWSEEFAPDQTSSGYGKDSFTATMDYLNPQKHVGLAASTPDGSVSTGADMTVSPVKPSILWYASSPLYGPLYNNAILGTYVVSGNDSSIIALPYFFSPKSDTSAALKYSWQLNGAPISTPSTPNTLFLHRDNTAVGAATVDVSVMNPSRLFQEAENSLELSLQ